MILFVYGLMFVCISFLFVAFLPFYYYFFNAFFARVFMLLLGWVFVCVVVCFCVLYLFISSICWMFLSICSI